MADVSLVGWREQGYEEEMQLLREEKEGCPFWWEGVVQVLRLARTERTPDAMENRTAAEELQDIKEAVKSLATKQNLIKAGTCAVGVFVVGMIAVHFGADQMVYRWLNPWAPL